MEISIIVLVGGDYDKNLYAKNKKSLQWADEIIEIKTKNIKGGFADWRNEGAKLAKGDWVLYVDTDEEISLKLQKEIFSLITNHRSSVTSYAIPRRNFIFGKEFKYGGQRPDYQKRLFRKDYLKGWKGDLHEEPVFKGSTDLRIGHLKNRLIHRKNSKLSDMVEKTNKWSEIEAQLMFDSNHPKMNIFRFFSAAIREFWLRFVRQLCFLDGTRGIIYGAYQVYSKLISYSKLWEKQLSTIRT